jgi:hypothetical protein
VIAGVGIFTTILMILYDRIVKPGAAAAPPSGT